MMSARSSVMPPRRKLEKLVMATALRVRKAAKMTAFMLFRKLDVDVNVAMKADRITTRLVTEPSTKSSNDFHDGFFF